MEVENNRTEVSFFLNAMEEKKKGKSTNTHNGCFKDKTQRNRNAGCF